MSGLFSRTGSLGRVLYKSVNFRSVLKQNQSFLPFARSLVVLSNSTASKKSLPRHSITCSCGCGIHGMHTKGDRELVEFLQDEIVSEKKNLQAEGIPSKLDDFSIMKEYAELKLTKKFNDEEITVSLNVNHTVDSTPGVNEEEDQEAPLQSRPDFEVDIKIGPKTLSFTCQFTGPEPEQETDVFGISEVTIFDGEWDENKYCVSGEILDGQLYDLFMNMLEERGITGDFMQKLSTICTYYEHSLYIKMLQDIQNLIKRK